MPVESKLRKELAAGFRTTTKMFWMEGDLLEPFTPKYREIFTSREVEGKNKGSTISNSGIENITFFETGAGEEMRYSTPSGGRDLPMTKRRFTTGMEIARDDVRDGVSDVITNRIRDFARNAVDERRRRQERYYWDILNYGGYTLGHAIFDQSGDYKDNNALFLYDGKPLFNLTANGRSFLKLPEGASSGTTYFNLYPSGTALTPQNYQKLLNTLTATNAFSDEGKEISMDGKLILIYHPDNEVQALTLLRSTHLPSSANNDINIHYKSATPLRSRWLRNSASWAIFMPNRKWIAYDQEQPIIESWFDQERKLFKVTIDTRWGFEIRAFTPIVAADFPQS